MFKQWIICAMCSGRTFSWHAVKYSCFSTQTFQNKKQKCQEKGQTSLTIGRRSTRFWKTCFITTCITEKMWFRKSTQCTGFTRRTVSYTYNKSYSDIVFFVFSKVDSPVTSSTQQIQLFIFWSKVLYRDTKQTWGSWLLHGKQPTLA